jgi:ribosomal protein S18 acetylase RimI-like enzyme
MSALQFRLATPADLPHLREMIIDSFEPITWYKKLDERFGPLNHHTWRDRWHLRLDKIFVNQILLVGALDGQVVAAYTGTVDPDTLMGYIDLLGVDRSYQGRGFGREMLRGMCDHFRGLGMEQAYLDCLTDNTRGNALYASEGWQTVSSSQHWFTKL